MFSLYSSSRKLGPKKLNLPLDKLIDVQLSEMEYIKMTDSLKDMLQIDRKEEACCRASVLRRDKPSALVPN